MKKTVLLSLCTILAFGEGVEQLTPMSVESEVTTERVENISSEELKSADLAEALQKNSASVSIVRRSGIANDIIVRGQKKDNLSITIDGAKVCGACPNRMDPPTSHVNSVAVDSVSISEGPFDVETAGSLSATVKIETTKPKEGLNAEVGLNGGSFGYMKGYTTLSGGNNMIKALISYSYEKSGQYLDGEGNDFAAQLENKTSSAYATSYKSLDAYTKQMAMAKIFVTPTENQEIKLGYTVNKSDNILYPSTSMDADYDNSYIYTVDYSLNNLASFSKAIDLSYYATNVDHPMSTKYRTSGATMYMTNHLTTAVSGAKLKNTTELDDGKIVVGLDMSSRNWNGAYSKTAVATGVVTAMNASIDNANTLNKAVFLKGDYKLFGIKVDAGTRFDTTTVTSKDSSLQSNTYDSISFNALATYNITDTLSIFAGGGKSHRVPDGKELYFQKMTTGADIGTDTLKQTRNYELDGGLEYKNDMALLKLKGFYSVLRDYIYYNKTNAAYHAYENISATIYGGDITLKYNILDTLTLDTAIAYQRGTKESALSGQSDLDLAEIPPLKANIALHYEHDETLKAKFEYIASAAWSDYDSDNGEQAIGAWGIFNLKASKTFARKYEIALGVNNILNATYAVSNTYSDLTLLTGDNNQVMLLNEAGRYYYANFVYKY